MTPRTVRKLENSRSDALSRIHEAESSFQQMVARCVSAGEVPDPAVASRFLTDIAKCAQQISSAGEVDELKRLANEADCHALLRAYVCPTSEIYLEGTRLIDLLRDWGIPNTSLSRLAASLDDSCKPTPFYPVKARAVLREIMHQVDVDDDYVEQLEKELRNLSICLVVLVGVSLFGAIVSLDNCAAFPVLFQFSLVFAGVGGSCASVLARMPSTEVATSAVSLSLIRLTLSRVGTGVAGSITGCALLAWGVIPLTINNLSFDSVLSACGPNAAARCTPTYSLIAIAVPIVLGFSERLLTSLEGQLLGGAAERHPAK